MKEKNEEYQASGKKPAWGKWTVQSENRSPERTEGRKVVKKQKIKNIKIR